MMRLETRMDTRRVHQWVPFGTGLSTMLVVGAGILSCVFGKAPEVYWENDPVWSPDGQHIAFQCYYGKPDWEGFYRDDGYEICVIGADGHGFMRLTINERTDWNPAWSPDGTRIAFTHQQETGNWVVMLVDVDGGNLVELAKGNEHPVWSPSGRYIAVSTSAGNLALINVEEGVSIPLSSTEHQDYDSRPTWSPDGQRIAFVSSRDGHEEIYVVNADGTGETRLTYGANHSSTPTWSPDGRLIAFFSLKDYDPEEIDSHNHWGLEVMESDGSNRVRLLLAAPGEKLWEPDSQHILYSSGYGEALRISVDGKERAQLPNIPGDHRLNFSSDGQRVAVVRGGEDPASDGGTRIWIVNADGSGESKLTEK